MKTLLLLCLACLPFAAGCLRNTAKTNPDVEATSTGPCKDDERLENGKCAPRIPGD